VATGPVRRTPLSPTPLFHALTSYLYHLFAPGVTVLGSVVEV
jgi:hypothetical protein